MITTQSAHKPVLLEEAIANLAIDPAGLYIDGTFGGGGHTAAVLDRFPDTRVIAFDRDPDAIGRAVAIADHYGSERFHIVHAPFAEMAESVAPASVAGILLDLGFSSFQIDDPERGFAFRSDGPLDMRFDPSTGQSAADFLNDAPETEIADVLWRFGEERRSRQIARAVVANRPISSTSQLANLIAAIVGHHAGRGHPATRSFQALRIAVNGELDQLQTVLGASLDLLAEGGRLVVISFHSLEDRIIKQFIRDASAPCVCPPEQVICTCHTTPKLRPIGKAVRASAEEEDANPRSRSAIMRTAERLPRQDAA
jgi:16S rRNA (cytosine1402-N4)-methyltransferase